MSGYTPNKWVDREGTTRYFETVDDDGALIFTPDYTQVTEMGTPVNEDNMNHIEEGIAAVSFSKYDSMTTYAKDDLVTAIVDNELKVYKSLQDNNNGNPLTDANYWEEVEIAGGGGGTLQMFDTILKDHILTYEESKGLALQGTYVYKDAIAGSRYGYPDFYNKVVEEKTVNTVTTFEQYVQSNVSLQGNVRDNFGVLSNFSTSNYAVLPYNHAPASGDTWEFVLKITTGDDVTDTQQFVGGTEANNGGVEVAVVSSRFKLWLASSASSADIASGVVGTYAVLPSTTYWVKIAFDGSAYTLSYSLDGETYIVDITVSSTTIVKGEQRSLGADAFQVNDPWSGTIDLNGCYIDVNGERQWSGVETVKVYQNANKHAFYDIAEKSKIDTIYNKYGVAWYYGVDTEEERVFLPRNDYFEQLTGDPADVGRFIEAGLPNITGNVEYYSWSYVVKKSGAFAKSNNGSGGGYGDAARGEERININIDASDSNPIYSNSDTVQPNAVKKLLYICVGNTTTTSAVTDVTEVTTTENDTLPLFASMYFDFKPNNVSWLKGGQQQNNAGIYTFAYNELVNVLNGETKYGDLKVINEADMIAGVDYSEYWKVNQEALSFTCPIRTKERILVAKKEPTDSDPTWYNLYSDGYLEQGGIIFTSGSVEAKASKTVSATPLKPFKILSTVDAIADRPTYTCVNSNSTTTTISISCKNTNTGDTDSGFQQIRWNANGYAKIPTVSEYTENVNLYFKVANAVQNLELLDVGEVLETLSSKVDINSKVIDGQWVYTGNVTLSNATGTSMYTIDLSSYLPDDGQIYEVMLNQQGAYSENSTYSGVQVKSDIIEDFVAFGYPQQYSRRVAGQIILPVGTARSIVYQIWNHALGSNSGLKLIAYRRIGTNQ